MWPLLLSPPALSDAPAMIQDNGDVPPFQHLRVPTGKSGMCSAADEAEVMLVVACAGDSDAVGEAREIGVLVGRKRNLC